MEHDSKEQVQTMKAWCQKGKDQHFKLKIVQTANIGLMEIVL